MIITTSAAPTAAADLSLTRLHLMRAGYCLLTAMSLLAFLGLRYPVKLLPVLLFESAWKLLWLALVALPRAATGRLDAATTETVVSCSLVVVILAVIPWRYAWRAYVRATGDRWRTTQGQAR